MEIVGNGFNFYNQALTARGIMVPKGDWLNVIRDVVLVNMDVVANQFDLYSFVSFQGRDKVRIGSLNIPQHILQAATNCKTWNPKGRVNLATQEISACRLEYNGEQCADELFGNCLEYLLGGGNDAYDMAGTAEGRRLLDEVVWAVTTALRESLYNVVTFSNHPLISDANSNDWWNTGKTDEQSWLDYVDQQTGVNCKGHLTLIDEIKDDGYDHFNVEIASGDLSADKKEFTGDAMALISKVIRSAQTKFDTAIRNRLTGYGAVIGVTKSIYHRLEDQLAQSFDNPASYSFLVTDNGIQRPMAGALLYKGKVVKCMDEWDRFYELTGTIGHRVVMTAPGNMVVGYDTDNLDGIAGGGLIIDQSMRAKEKKRIDMFTAFKTGAAIANHEFMVNASIEQVPS